MEKELLNLILFEIREVKGDMSEVKVRLTNLETDMSEVKVRLTNLEERMTNVEANMSEVKVRLINLETDMSDVKVRLTNLENRMTNVEDLAQFNKETSESIKNVVTSHYMEFKKYIKSNDTQHNLYNAKLLQYKKEN